MIYLKKALLIVLTISTGLAGIVLFAIVYCLLSNAILGKWRDALPESSDAIMGIFYDTITQIKVIYNCKDLKELR